MTREDELEPVRLVDGGDANLRALIHAARSYEPSTEGRDRVLELLVQGGAAALVSAALPSATLVGGATKWSSGWLAAWAGKLAAKGVLNLSLAALVVGGAGGTTAALLLRSKDDAAQSPAVPLNSESAEPRARVPADDESFVDTALSEPEPAVVVPAKPESATESKEVQAVEPRVGSSSEEFGLSDQIAELTRAKRDLAQGDAVNALARLREHERRAPSSSLGLEREVLMIEALAAVGRTQEAQRRAARFAKAHPHHVLSDRLRPYLNVEAEENER